MVEESDDRMVDKRAASRLRDDEGQPAPEASPPPGDETRSELEIEREKADAYYKNWQRSAADFANYKRRVEQERTESSRLINAALVINLLPVFDDLDRAVASVDSTLAGLNWVQGVVNIHHKFGRLLDALGVTEIAAENEASIPPGTRPSASSPVMKVKSSTSPRRATSCRARLSGPPWSSSAPAVAASPHRPSGAACGAPTPITTPLAASPAANRSEQWAR